MLGADINKPVKHEPQETAKDMQYSEILGYAPLILVMLGGDFHLIEILIDHSATVQHKS